MRLPFTWLVGAWILLDIVAHLGNLVNVLSWLGVPFAYGTVYYEITALAYWTLGFSMWLLSRYNS